jgi:amino acid adenylation domain-containing protein
MTRGIQTQSPDDGSRSAVLRRRRTVSIPRTAQPACLHAVFEAQARRSPTAVAVAAEGRHITYRELDARAEHIARSLRAHGVGPEVPVGLCLDRSIELVVGLVAILKAGGAYVPLDPAYPRERLAFLLADSGVSAVVTDRASEARLPEGAATRFRLDDDADFARGSAGGRAVVVPGNMAYVIYTSGSTGRPKGVPVTHSNVLRLLTATRHWFGFGPNDVWTLFHSFAFDFSVWEIWGALLHGGRLVIVPHAVSRSPEAFHELLCTERVTVLNQTPSAFRQLVRADEDAGARASDLALRLVIFGGEALDPRALQPWFARHGDQSPRIVNMYGITETTVHVTYRPIRAADAAQTSTSSPIGRAIPDLVTYVLDRRFDPVPVGVVGELYVGGAGVARGYLGRPALTAERFVPDPFSSERGARLYRSGDLARRRPSGELEYVGRADQQVKVRGFRVELGEIEAALSGHPAVREAAVVAREAAGEGTRIVAYVAPREITSRELRRWLAERLPEFMVPAAIVGLDSLPLTAHGKIDRRALPAPEGDRNGLGDVYVAPRTSAEDAVANAWAEVLGLTRVGADDDFFELGGHSLLAAQVMSRLRVTFAAHLPLRAIFEARTVAALASRFESAGRTGALAPIRRVTRTGPPPLSYAQRALWFLDRMTPGEPVFHVTAAARVRGPLDLNALRLSLAELVRRHETLRTTFALEGDEPVQVIAPALDVPLELTDLRELPESQREARVEEAAIDEARRPFDLARGPLVRACVLCLGETEHAVMLTMHHIVTDGWSMGVAASELAALYAAAGRSSLLPELPAQYADFAVWQRERLRGPMLDELIGYWTKRLTGLTPLELTTDRPRPAVRSARGATRFFRLPAQLTAALDALSRREGTTLFMTLLTAFQTLLHRYSGQDDIAVGTPVAGRDRPEIEGLIGYFVNMVVLRADLSGDPAFRELLGRVREVVLGAFEHQELPFDRVVEALRPARDPSRTPLFQVMFVLQNNRMQGAAPREIELEGLTLAEGTGTAKFDLTLALEQTGSELRGSFEYSTDLFDESTIERMVGHFRNLLGDIVARPARRLSELEILSPDEYQQVVHQSNETRESLPAISCIHRLFEEQVKRRPDAIAVDHLGQPMSYGELNARSNRLARALRRRGIRAGSRVAVALEGSPELAIALLGILKAGGAYVPLDPVYPGERLRLLLDDSQAELVLTRRGLHARLAPLHGAVIDLDTERFAEESPANLEGGATPDDGAYVIHTSGSTGTPAGVLVSHRGVVNHSLAASKLFGLRPADRVLQLASISFDIAVEELFPAWLAGATVVTRGEVGAIDPARLAELIKRQQITLLDLPTAYWHAWVEVLALGGTIPEPLRMVVVGGERASSTAFERWRSLAGDRVRWINTYGPTEATVIATAYEPALDEHGREIAIGKPIANMQVYLLDRWLRPVVTGQSGEIFIGGDGVARGYLGRPALTAERFVPDPFGGKPGARLFRTGDRGRWRADGALEFMGRVDHQIKVRGFRVEPGEIEIALRAHAAVRDAVIVARTSSFGDGRLDAYVAAESEPAELAVELRRALKDKLPAYLVPSSFTIVPVLPLTPSGKVDRRALPAPVMSDAGGLEGAAGPRDETEVELVAIWQEVLDVRPIGVNDNFFDLGGHSLLAIRLLARIEARFGRTLSLTALLGGATVGDLAVLLREAPRATSTTPLVALRGSGSRSPFFCVHPAGGIVYCFHELARHLPIERPFFALQAPGLDGEREPFDCVETMAESYVQAILRARPEGPYHLGGWSLGGLIAFEIARQMAARGLDVGTVAMFDTAAPAARGRSGMAHAVTSSLRELCREAAALLSDDPRDERLMFQLAHELARGFGGDPRRLVGQLRAIAPERRLDHVLKFFELDRVYHLETSPQRVRQLWNVLRANLVAAARYQPEPFVGRVLLFRADQRRDAGSGGLGWETLALGGVTVHSVAGDHASILKAPAVAHMATVLEAELEAAERVNR